MLATYLCIGICAIIWIVNGIWIRQAVKERFTSEIYIHTGLGVFFTMLALELTIGIRGAWTHFGISWLGLIGWILYIPSAILVFGSMIELKRKGKPRTYDPSYTTTFVDTGIYGIIRQPITLGMAIWSIALILVFLTGLNCSNLSSNDLNLKLERSVSELVEKDKSVRNCVLAVTKGDGSYSWAGAAGIATQDGQVPMTKDTPIYIASITKLYTATAIMKLYEEGALSLDDPIFKYLPADLIQGIHVYEGRA
jgi:protein-S-isoprenylcysteine O-methyltransferase Ste14